MQYRSSLPTFRWRKLLPSSLHTTSLFACMAYGLTLKLLTVCFPETSVNLSQAGGSQISEDSASNLTSYKSLYSQMVSISSLGFREERRGEELWRNMWSRGNIYELWYMMYVVQHKWEWIILKKCDIKANETFALNANSNVVIIPHSFLTYRQAALVTCP